MSAHALVVPGGGQLDDCTLPKQVQLRYDAALDVYAEAFRSSGGVHSPVIICLSAGTPHKPNPRDLAGFDSKESTVGARYVLMRAGLLPRPDGTVVNDRLANELFDAMLCDSQLGEGVTVDPSNVWEENVSLDTIGNAYHCRTMHTDPAGLRNLVVVTNAFHMPRTRAIFDAVFALRSSSSSSEEEHAKVATEPDYNLSYITVADDDSLAADVADARRAREAASLKSFHSNWAINGFTTLRQLHAWLYSQHNAYASKRLLVPPAPIDPKLLATY